MFSPYLFKKLGGSTWEGVKNLYKQARGRFGIIKYGGDRGKNEEKVPTGV